MKKIKITKIISVFIIIVVLWTIVGCDRNKETSTKKESNTKKQTTGEAKFGEPIIYLYPTCQEKVSVKLDYKGKLMCTYPDYKDGWSIIANPDGRLINTEDNKEYSYLFWEGVSTGVNWDLSKGYVVEGNDTKNFLQNKLSELGLTPKEYNEFIVYWLPQMQNNKYNLITFQNQVYDDVSRLDINPKPDSLLRVFMAFKSLNERINVAEPTVKPFQRKGFTVIEWGGTEIK